jgi:transcriptional regulator with XRE-family HTH domain
MKFSENLQVIRRERKLSQEELAEKLGVSRQAVTKWESGSAFPDIDNLIQISELFCVTIDSLVKTNSDCTVKPGTAKDLDRERIIGFLLNATKNTYAGKGKAEETSCRPGSYDLKYAEGNLMYFDSYFGGEKFSGEELLFENNTPLWAMNYSGRTLEDSFSPDFLKEVLLLRSAEAPFRGPRIYQNGIYIYYNTYQGDFNWFQGKEEIYWGGVMVYECFYHGGLVI